METEKSHDLLSVSWRPSRGQGDSSVHTQRPKNQGSQWCQSWSESEGLRSSSTDTQGQERTDVLAQAEGVHHLSLAFLFYLGPPHVG